jgi:hypothetical protein
MKRLAIYEHSKVAHRTHEAQGQAEIVSGSELNPDVLESDSDGIVDQCIVLSLQPEIHGSTPHLFLQ